MHGIIDRRFYVADFREAVEAILQVGVVSISMHHVIHSLMIAWA